MSGTKYSLNILLVECVHFLIGTGFGLVPWGWAAGIAFVLWKALYRDVKKNYGDHGIRWLWDVPAALWSPDDIYRPTLYRWGPGPLRSMPYQRKAWLDMTMYFTGMALGIWWQWW